MIKFFKSITRRLKRPQSPRALNDAVVIPRQTHSISRKQISPNALTVLYRLNKSGYEAYLVGGGVRDLLLGIEPKDFDVATNAKPEEVRRIFRNSRLIGRRFRLAHVYFGDEIIEVATFRAAQSEKGQAIRHQSSGMITDDNVFGTLKDDAWRRDFTINALYYNIADFSVVDFTGGWQDIQSRQLCMIGDPKLRYQEDPVRMIRAIRFASKLNLKLPKSLTAPMKSGVEQLYHVPPARLFEEVLKIFHSGHAQQALPLLIKHGVFQCLFPQTHHLMASSNTEQKALLDVVLASTDARIQAGKPVTPAFLFLALLWQPIVIKANAISTEPKQRMQAYDQAFEAIMSEQIKHTAIPKRISQAMREIMQLMLRLQKKYRKPAALVTEPRFRAAYDFLLMRRDASEAETKAIADWWQDFVEGDEATQAARLKELPRPRRRRSKKSKPRNDGSRETTAASNPAPSNE